MEIIKEVFKLLSNVGVFGLAMWFIQMLLSKSAERKFESYKNELDQKTKEFQFLLDSKLETYKIELNLQNYKATKVYEQQLNIVIDLHRNLTNLNKEMVLLSLLLMKNITDKTDETEKNEIEQAAKAITTYDNFVLFYHNNLIFIPQKIVDKINDIIGEYSKNFLSYFNQRGTNNEITYEQAFESAKKLSTDINQALGLLTIEFKKQLGVEN